MDVEEVVDECLRRKRGEECRGQAQIALRDLRECAPASDRVGGPERPDLPRCEDRLGTARVIKGVESLREMR
jgi:hypothetical protein